MALACSATNLAFTAKSCNGYTSTLLPLSSHDGSAMHSHFSQTPEQLLEEIDFWLDFIRWWEQKHGRPAQRRAREALEDAQRRYLSVTESCE